MRQLTRYLSTALLTLVLCLAASGALAQGPRRTVTLPGPWIAAPGPGGQVRMVPREAIADRVLVSFAPGRPPAVGSFLPCFAGARVARVLDCGVAIVELPAGSDILAAAAALATDPMVASAEPDTLVYPRATIPNDPEYPKQYHLPLIRAPEAWDVSTGSSGVVVAVIDSGVDLDHPDLASNIFRNPRESVNGRDDDGNGKIDDTNGWNFVGNNNNPNPVPVSGADNSLISHGTLVAGIIAAVGNDNWGTAGITWNCKILPIKVFSNDGAAEVSTILSAIDYAVATGAKVINLSLGGAYGTVWSPAIDRAHNAGCVVVAAGGNSSRTYTDSTGTWESPVCNDGPNMAGGDNYVLGVAATDRNDKRQAQSNSDDSSYNLIDVSAPGELVYGPAYYDPSFPGFGSYFYYNTGTSFSAPMVSALAALVLSVHPTYTPDQVTNIIRASTDNIDAANPAYAGMLGTGRINLAKALGVELAPAAVTALKAADTTGDEGGSITLTWVKSADDGAGLNSVTGYEVSRRTGASGAWTALATLPKGTQRYIDATTTDKTDYYYKVRTVAGSLGTDSAIVGPVQSRNDAPPPKVTDLTAVDRPGDSGGAIVLSWTMTPPADYAQTRIYRKTTAFTSVTGMTPIWTLAYSGTTGSKVSMSYTDTTTTDGVDYHYAVVGVDSEGSFGTAVSPAGPVQSYPNVAVNFDAGVHLFASPVVPPDGKLLTLLGIPASGLQVARYNPTSATYELLTTPSQLGALRTELGRSLWLRLVAPTAVAPVGNVAPSGDFTVPLTAGWHHLGNPFFGSLDFGAATVTTSATTMDLRAAHLGGLLASYGWLYDPASGEYRLLSTDAPGTRLVPPWRGFWVRALAPCTLNLKRFTGASAIAAAVPVAAEQASPGWLVTIRADAAGMSDTQNWLGVRPGAAVLQIEAPPPIGDGVSLDFIGDHPAAPALAGSFLLAEAEKMTWRLRVCWGTAPGRVRLSWPDLSAVPSAYSVTVRDLDNGKAISARHQAGYEFAATDDGGQRLLELAITRRTTGALLVSAMSAQESATGAQVAFTLTQPAACDVTVMNIAGRPVRTLASDSILAAGTNAVLWDGRNSAGAKAPAGLYLVRVTARGEDGAIANALSTLRVTR